MALYSVTYPTVGPDCAGTGLEVHVGRTDGSRTECLICRRLVDTTPTPGEDVFRTVVAHQQRRPTL